MNPATVMTPDEAKLKILEKVLSLKTGWRQESCKVSIFSSRSDYSHPELPDLLLTRTDQFVKITTLPENLLVAAYSSPPSLFDHVDAILRDIQERENQKRNARIIQIAQSL